MQTRVHRNNLSENWLHSSDPKTRRKVSCEGMPPGRGRNLLSHSLRVSPNNSMSGQSSAPHNTARIAMAIMSSNRWSQRPTTRGSSRSLKHAFKPPKKSRVASSMIEPSLALDRGGAGSPPDYARPSCVTYSQVALYVQLLMRQPCRVPLLGRYVPNGAGRHRPVTTGRERPLRVAGLMSDFGGRIATGAPVERSVRVEESRVAVFGWRSTFH